jgi:hypothetical protein
MDVEDKVVVVTVAGPDRRTPTDDREHRMTAPTGTQEDQRTQTKIGLAALVVPVFFGIMFAACIIGAYHTPHPNNIKVAVVGPPAQTAPVVAGLQKAAGSGFDISQAPAVAQAADDVRQRHLDAAFVPTADPKQPATIIVASAGGRIVATAAETLARSAAAAQGTQLAIREVRPLADGDEIGLGVFLFLVVCTICGYITPTILETLVPSLVPSRRYPLIAAAAILVPTFVYLIGGLGYGTYEGSFGTILAFIGIGALYMFAIGMGTRLLQALIGPVAILISLTIFVFLNIPSLGATYTAPVLPGFWHFLNHFWIGAATVDAERGILYFGGLGVGTALLKLLAWAVVIVVLLLLPVSRRLEREREHAVSPAAPTPAGAAV